jgi:uncharacterized membrane protein
VEDASMAKKAPPRKTVTIKNDKSNDKLTMAQNEPTEMIVDDRGLAFAVYVLYLVGYFTGITAIIGAIIAYLQSSSANPEIKSHYIFQIKTFWIGFCICLPECCFYILVLECCFSSGGLCGRLYET